MKKILLAIILVPLLLVAGGAVFLTQYDWNAEKSRLTKILSDKTGRDVEIAGNMNLRFWPNLALTASDIRMANFKGAQNPDFIRAESLAVQVALMPLLSGAVDVESIEINAPQIVLEEGKNGQKSWDIAPATAPQESAAPESADSEAPPAQKMNIAIRQIEMIDGALLYVTPGQKTPTKIDDVNLELELETLAGPFSAEGAFSFGDEDVEFEIDLGALGTAISPTLLAEISYGDYDVHFDGKLTQQGKDWGLNGGIKSSIPSPDHEEVKAFTKGTPIQISGQVDANSEKAKLSDLKIAMGELLAQGNIAYDLKSKSIAAEIAGLPGQTSLAISSNNFAESGAADLKVASQNLRKFLALFGVTLPQNIPHDLVQSADLSAKLLQKDQKIAVQNLQGKIDSLNFAGNVTFDQTNQVMDLVLKIPSVDADLYWPKRLAETTSHEDASSSASSPAASKKGNMAVNFQIDLGKATYHKIAYEKIVAQGSWQNQILNLTKLSVGNVADAANIAASGKIDLRQAAEGQIDVTAAIKDSRKLFAQYGYNVTETMAVDAKALVSLAKDSWQANLNFAGSARKNSSGEIKISSQKSSRPLYEIEAVLRKLNLEEVTSFDQKAASQAAASGQAAPKTKAKDFDLSFLQKNDLRYDILIDQASMNQKEVKQLAVKGTAKDGQLTLDQMMLEGLGGNVFMTGALNAKGIPAMELSGRFDQISLEEMAKIFPSLQKITGLLNADFKLDSLGKNKDEMTQNLAGLLNFKLEKGVIKGVDLAAVSNRLDNLDGVTGFLSLIKTASAGGETPYDLFGGQFVIEKGIARAKDVNLVSETAVGKVEGVINLPQEIVDLNGRFGLKAHDQAPPLGVVARGPFANPKMTLDSKDLQSYAVSKSLEKLKRRREKEKEQAQQLEQQQQQQQAAPENTEGNAQNVEKIEPATGDAPTPEATPEAAPETAPPAGNETGRDWRGDDKERPADVLNDLLKDLF